MSEPEHTDADTDTDESCDEIPSDNKALPWHSMDVVKIDEKADNDSSDESSISDSSSKKKTFNNNSTALEHSVSKDLEKMQIKTKNQNPSRNYFQEDIQQRTVPEHALCDVDMKVPPIEINLLLLGESGVGKSTFINSFANYMKHENFEAVQQSVLSVLIPARFNIFDKEFKKHVISIGANDANEYLADGAAATQDVKTYVFNIILENKAYLIRLIDTPGMGDPRGIDQDNKNCDYVLSYLGRLEKIHAICVLLKPTNTRLDVFLNYCVTQILSRLEKSAIDNISFFFTNTRGQNYTPGDTYTSLELLVKKIKDTNNVCLPLSHKNVFCFDNEAFRFLASIKQGVEFREGILEANIESWKYSYKEVYRALSYIVQLKPHDPQKTISINHARKMVLQLSQPLAEIVQLIGDNIYELEQHTHQLLMENQTLEELKQKLYMPVVDIRVKELTQPVTACTAPQCSTIYKVADKNKFHYKQRCHNPCYLNNVPAEIVGDPHLLDCWAMNKSTQTCHQCGCRFNTHMHIYYETDTFQSKIVDANVEENIHNKEDATREKEIIIDKVLNQKEQLEKEHKHIIKCSAAFAHFLQQNAITPMNDSLKEYVKYLITREENLGPETNKATLVYLRRLLAEYEQEKSVLEEALKQNTSGIVNSSPGLIEAKIKELFTLPNFGKKIKQLYDLHQSGGIQEHKQSEHIVQERYVLKIVADKVKSYGTAVLGAFGLGKSKKQHRLELEQQRALECEKFERRHFGNQLKIHPGMHSNSQFSGLHGYYFGPNGPKFHYDSFEPYSQNWESEEYPAERARYHRQYQLEGNGGDEDRSSLFNSKMQFSEDGSGQNYDYQRSFNEHGYSWGNPYDQQRGYKNEDWQVATKGRKKQGGEVLDTNGKVFPERPNHAAKCEAEGTSKNASKNADNKKKNQASGKGQANKEGESETQVAKIKPQKGDKKKNKKNKKDKKK